MAAAALLGVTACTSAGPSGSAGSCAGPVLEAEPERVRAGQEVTVSGRWFFLGCADSFRNGTPSETQEPITDITVTVLLDGRTVAEEETGASGEDDSFSVTLALPADLPPGTAVVATDVAHAPEAEFSIESE